MDDDGRQQNKRSKDQERALSYNIVEIFVSMIFRSRLYFLPRVLSSGLTRWYCNKWISTSKEERGERRILLCSSRREAISGSRLLSSRITSALTRARQESMAGCM